MDIGIPHDLWDATPAEVTALERACASLLGEYESLIEHWFFEVLPTQGAGTDISEILCRQHALHNTYNSAPARFTPPFILTSFLWPSPSPPLPYSWQFLSVYPCICRNICPNPVEHLRTPIFGPFLSIHAICCFIPLAILLHCGTKWGIRGMESTKPHSLNSDLCT